MNKKIIATSILLIIVVSITIIFISFNQADTNIDQNDYSSNEDAISDDEISEEINDYFLSEDDEVEIGDMI